MHEAMRDYATACASLGLLVSFPQESYAPSQRAFQTSLYLWCPLTTLKTAPFNTARDDKINDRGLNFSVACEWHVLIKEDKDNSLQFAKVFPAKLLKLPIHQSFILFFTVLHYTVSIFIMLFWHQCLA